MIIGGGGSRDFCYDNNGNPHDYKFHYTSIIVPG